VPRIPNEFAKNHVEKTNLLKKIAQNIQGYWFKSENKLLQQIFNLAWNIAQVSTIILSVN
jgi:hypothetical protein